jgi:hypothetical protein
MTSLNYNIESNRLRLVADLNGTVVNQKKYLSGNLKLLFLF